MKTSARTAPVAYVVWGHGCVDFIRNLKYLSAKEAKATRNCMLGLKGFDRGTLIDRARLLREHQMTIEDLVARQGDDLHTMPMTIGGPGLAAAEAIHKFARPDTIVSYRGLVAPDWIGDEMRRMLKENKMNDSGLAVTEAKGVGTSFTYITQEKIKGSKDIDRSFVHDNGTNALKYGAYPEDAFKLPRAERVIAQFGGNFLCKGMSPGGILKVLGNARKSGAVTILNTVFDSDEIWNLGKNASSVVDLLIMDSREAAGISGIEEKRILKAPFKGMEWFISNGFHNVVITLGTAGAVMHARDNEVFNNMQPVTFMLPASRYAINLGVVKSTTGCGDYAAGALAVAAGEYMTPQDALAFAMACGGLRALQYTRKPVEQGGNRQNANWLANKLMRQRQVVRSGFSSLNKFEPAEPLSEQKMIKRKR